MVWMHTEACETPCMVTGLARDLMYMISKMKPTECSYNERVQNCLNWESLSRNTMMVLCWSDTTQLWSTRFSVYNINIGKQLTVETLVILRVKWSYVSKHAPIYSHTFKSHSSWWDDHRPKHALQWLPCYWTLVHACTPVLLNPSFQSWF